MENTLEKILSFNKRQLEESELFDELMKLFSYIENSSSEDNDNNIIEEYEAIDKFLNKVLSGILDGKISIAKFNKICKDESLNDFDLDKLFNFLKINDYSEINTRLLANFFNRNAREKTESKKIDFASLMIFSKMKDIIVPFKVLINNGLTKNIGILNKFVLLSVFRKWKELGYISTSNVDDMIPRNVFNRYFNTCKTAVYNIYARFTADAKNPYILTDNLDEKYKRELVLLNDNKSSEIISITKALFKMDIYSKYRDTYNVLANDIFEYGSAFRLQNFLNTDVILIENLLYLTSCNIVIGKNNPYNYCVKLDGTFKINISFNNSELTYSFNDQYGIFGKGSDVYKLLEDTPTNILNNVITLYNKFGFNVDTGTPSTPTISNKISIIHDMRNQENYDITLFALSCFNTRSTFRMHSNNYSCINRMVYNLFNTISLIKSDLGFDQYFIDNINIFMPFVFFIFDINYILDLYGNGNCGILQLPLFIIDTDCSDQDKDNQIINNFCDVLKRLKDVDKPIIKKYDNFNIDILCKVYRIYLKNLSFDISEDVYNNTYIFFIHLNNFFKTVVNHINNCYIKSNIQNILSFDDFLYLDKALKKCNIIEEEVENV